MSVKTVKVSNVSLKASEQDIQEFFSFSGDIQYLEVKSDNEESRIAYVTFKDSQGANTAVLLSGATIAEKTVTINLDPDYELPPDALPPPPDSAQEALRKAEDVVTTMLAKGFVLGKDALNQAKTFDEKHQLTSTATLKIQSLDQKYGVTEKISMGTAVVNSKVKEMDEKYEVSEKTKTAIAVAEEKVSNAGSVLMKNRYVLTGASWVTGAFNRVAKAAGEVGQKTREKVETVEEQQKRKTTEEEEEFSDAHLSEIDSDSAKPVPLEVSSPPKEVSLRSMSPKSSSSPKATLSPKDDGSPPKYSSPKAADASPKAKDSGRNNASSENSAPTKEESSSKPEAAQGMTP